MPYLPWNVNQTDLEQLAALARTVEPAGSSSTRLQPLTTDGLVSIVLGIVSIALTVVGLFLMAFHTESTSWTPRDCSETKKKSKGLVEPCGTGADGLWKAQETALDDHGRVGEGVPVIPSMYFQRPGYRPDLLSLEEETLGAYRESLGCTSQ